MLSLIVWTLIVTVSVKYCLFVMRADNRGEGGILALMSLVGADSLVGKGRRCSPPWACSGAALIYGDGVITPAISVLSALEGVNVVTTDAEALRHAAGGGDPGRPVRGPALRHRLRSAAPSGRSCCCGSW